MELLLDILFEVYLELKMHIVPEEKAASKKYRILTVLIALMVLAGVLALFAWGIVLLAEHDNKLGILPIAVAAILSIVQIIAGFILNRGKSE